MTKPHVGFRHEELIYHGADEFVVAAAEFVNEGLAAGQPVLVAVAGEKLDRLQDAVADDAGVEFLDMAEFGRNPARIIPMWKRFIDQHSEPGQPLRGIGEPIWAGRRSPEVAECQLHEILLNLAVDPDTSLWLRCPYDAAGLDEPILQEAHRSHPVLVDSHGDYSGSTSYGGAHHAGLMFSDPLPDPPADAYELHFNEAMLGPGIREVVGRYALAAGLCSGRAESLGCAVHEVTINSVRHGGGSGTLRLWLADQALICEVRDRGRIEDLLVGRVDPGEATGGRGLWQANQCSDLLQIRSGPTGTVVRVVQWLQPELLAATG